MGAKSGLGANLPAAGARRFGGRAQIPGFGFRLQKLEFFSFFEELNPFLSTIFVIFAWVKGGFSPLSPALVTPIGNPIEETEWCCTDLQLYAAVTLNI